MVNRRSVHFIAIKGVSWPLLVVGKILVVL